MSAQGWNPPYRFPGSPALHFENLGVQPVPGDGYNVSATAHGDLVYAKGLFGGIGYGLVDGLGGHFAQLFGGNIDKKCLPE